MLELINEARSEYMLQESLYLDEGDGYAQEAPPPPYPSRAPPPQPPALAKYHIYNDPLEFADMDQIAISVSHRRRCSFGRRWGYSRESHPPSSSSTKTGTRVTRSTVAKYVDRAFRFSFLARVRGPCFISILFRVTFRVTLI